jgi:hypothetical protein
VREAVPTACARDGGGGSRPHLKFHLPGSRPATITFMMAKRTPVTRSPRYNNIIHNEERGAQMVSERDWLGAFVIHPEQTGATRDSPRYLVVSGADHAVGQVERAGHARGGAVAVDHEVHRRVAVVE